MRTLALLLLVLLVALLSKVLAEEPPKQPVPDATAQSAAVKLVAEVYKSDYDAANTPEQKIALARKLLREGVATKNDLLGKYVLLRIAKDVAIQHGDLGTVFQAIGEMTVGYEINELQQKVDAASTTMKTVRTQQANAAALPLIAALIEKGVIADRYDVANAASALALTTAREARDSTQTRRITTRIKEIDEMEMAFSKLRPALTTLAEDPTNAEANLTRT